ncbi:MAG: ABC transporter ATP-binding protein [Rubrivivax sp.]|nr:ABC transporter ATP-binding protein [Rubrivivax sp.]
MAAAIPAALAAALSDPRPLVKIERVSKRFPDGTLALQDLSLEIGEHDFISLLGPSGCGKSTALRLLAGLSPATSGKLTWAAHRTLGASRTDRELACVFRQPTLMPWSTVFDNVFLPLRLSGMTRRQADETVRDALAMVGLSQFTDTYPRGLSEGMKMRVSIARALVTQPRLMLMDEPFAALDETTRNRLNNDLLAIWREHRFTVIFVTHSVPEAVYLSSRIVVMAPRPGRVAREFRIGEPYPRHAGDFQVSSRYNEHVRAVQQVLRAATQGVPVEH